MKTLLAAFAVSVAAILAGSACVTAAGLLAFALAAARVLGTAIGAWVCSDDAYDACVSNPIARAAIDAAGGGEEAR